MRITAIEIETDAGEPLRLQVGRRVKFHEPGTLNVYLGRLIELAAAGATVRIERAAIGAGTTSYHRRARGQKLRVPLEVVTLA